MKAAYRRLALQWHPDRCPDEAHAAQRFGRLAEAYEVLGDPSRRARYDQSIASASAPPPAPNEGAPLTPLTAVIDSLFGARDRRPKSGRDRRYDLRVTFAEMALGVTKTLTVPKSEPCGSCQGRAFATGTWPLICESCDGAGAVTRTRLVRSAIERCEPCAGRGYTCPRPCPVCEGSGEVATPQRVSLTVPPNVKDGKVMVLRGLGEAGEQGANAGDCFVHVSVTDDSHLRRGNGLDVELTRPVPILRALLGGKIRVPTVDGPASISLPAGSKDGVVLVMRGFGIRDTTSDRRGAQRVTIVHEMPVESGDQHGSSLTNALETLLAQVDDGVFPESTAFDRSMKTRETSHE